MLSSERLRAYVIFLQSLPGLINGATVELYIIRHPLDPEAALW